MAYRWSSVVLLALLGTSCWAFDYPSTSAPFSTGATTGETRDTSSGSSTSSGGCDPACGEKVCGPDACGGTCGECSSDTDCTADGLHCACRPWIFTSHDYMLGMQLGPSGEVFFVDAEGRASRVDACTGDVLVPSTDPQMYTTTFAVTPEAFYLGESASSSTSYIPLDPTSLALGTPVTLSTSGDPDVVGASVDPTGRVWFFGQEGSTPASFSAPLWSVAPGTGTLSCKQTVSGLEATVGGVVLAQDDGLWLTAQTPRYGQATSTIAFVPYTSCVSCSCAATTPTTELEVGFAVTSLIVSGNDLYVAGWNQADSPATGRVEQYQVAADHSLMHLHGYVTPAIMGSEIVGAIAPTAEGGLVVGWADNFWAGDGFISVLDANLTTVSDTLLPSSTLITGIQAMPDGTYLFAGASTDGGFVMRCGLDLADCPSLSGR